MPKLLNRAALRANQLWHRRGQAAYNASGVDVFAEDWDVLVVLDACRSDAFEAHHDLPGELSSKESRGSTTNEWMRGNVAGCDLRDTAYVSASPSIALDADGARFAAVDHVWRDGWDEQRYTVPPGVTTDRATAAAEQHPNKRVVVHYLQPHYPFIGPTGSQFDYPGFETPMGDRPGFWAHDGLVVGDATDAELWAAYVENLRLACEAVAELHERVAGKVVVTADHGEMLGGRARPIPHRQYGHPAGLYTPELIHVPWLVMPFDDRRDVRPADRGVDAGRPMTDAVTDRLEDLGYMEAGG